MTDWREGWILFDDLRLEKAIGAGAFGEVWRARQLSWERDVAVKRVKAYDEARIRSMEREAIHWLEIGLHPYVTTCYYVRRYEGAPVIVLEYASGGALDGWLKDGRLLFEAGASELILKFGLQAAWGLACAHRAGLLHLDVKPANILVEGGAAKITDFGIASRLGQELTSAGTRAFASPEQLSREDVGDRADVFSWAVTLFALFRHEVDWAVGIAAPEVMDDAWALGDMPLKMPEDVYHLLRACMSEAPASRPSMEDAAEDLLYILGREYPDFKAPPKAIERQPLTAAEYNNRAVYLHDIGDLGGAAEHFRMAARTAADVTVPQYNSGLAALYAGETTPAKLLESLMNRGPGAPADGHIAAARLFMLNGDARSIAENPVFAEASPAARAWLEAGAPGALSIESPHTAKYMKPGDREKSRAVLTQGGLKAFNTDRNAIPVSFICSPQRKTFLLDNDKGALLLGGLNSGATPWMTCMIFRDKLRLKTAQFMGENAVLFVDGGFQLCDFSDPENLAISGMPDTPGLPALGDVRIVEIESLGNVSCAVFASRAGYTAAIYDFTDGVGAARTMAYTGRTWRSAPSVAFCADGSVLLGGDVCISPDEWGGERRVVEDPGLVLPSNNTIRPLAKIAGNFGAGATLIRHSAEYRDISGDFDATAFEYACQMKFAPYRFLAMAYDDTPASGGSLILEYEGEFFVSRIDKGVTKPPPRAEWLMMRAVSGAVAKDRRDVVLRAGEDYERLLGSGDFGGVVDICAALWPLVESRDEAALALWQRMARDFPRGGPLFATECEAARANAELSYEVKHPRPVYPAMPFVRPSSIGKVRFSYDHRGEAPLLIVSNGAAPPRIFPPVGACRLVVGAEGSEDGLFQALVYARQADDGTLTVGRRGILIRVFDVRGPECVLELFRSGLQTQEVFMRFSGHTLTMFIGGEGIFAIDFNSAREKITELPPPIIPDIISLHNVAFMGPHEDELFTGENRWRFYYNILPFPERPADDRRYMDIKPMLPKRPEEKRAALLRNGFGNLWAERIVRGK